MTGYCTISVKILYCILGGDNTIFIRNQKGNITYHHSNVTFNFSKFLCKFIV